MRIIYKYAMNQAQVGLFIPADAVPLTVQVQDGTAQLWVLQDLSKSCVHRRFTTFATGESILSEFVLGHIATWQNPGGLVFHTFEERLEP